MRLTNNDKNIIKNKIINECFSGLKKQIENLNLAFAENVYKHFIDYTLLSEMEEMPSNFFTTGKSMRVYMHLNDDKWASSIIVYFKNDKLLPYYLYAHGFQDMKIIKDENLIYQYQEIEKQKTQIEMNEKKLASKIDSLLASVNTLKQLENKWPEAVKHVPEKKDKKIMVINSKEINDMIETLKEK